MRVTECRGCGATLRTTMVDLGFMPLANSYVGAADVGRPEPVYPLRALVCEACLLVQLDEIVAPAEIFGEYAYFSSYSESWLHHARRYAEESIGRFGLNARSQVIEVGSNDGYLLQYFGAKGIPALGIEPAANVARAALAAGIRTRVSFFSDATASELVAEGIKADLAIANNVLAHVPCLHDFIEGFRTVLKPTGVATFEFPHLLRLIQGRQFDTIYHEHYSYFSLTAVDRLFSGHGLSVFDVQELPTHGGSLRVLVQHAGGPQRLTEAVPAMRALETAEGLSNLESYRSFGRAVEQVRAELVRFLWKARDSGHRVAAYGAPAKGSTLLNYCGIGADLIELTVDRNPIKQNRFLPGTRIPVKDPAVLREVKPAYLLLLAWNLRDEIASQMSWIGEWGGRFVVPIPSVSVWPAC